MLGFLEPGIYVSGEQGGDSTPNVQGAFIGTLPGQAALLAVGGQENVLQSRAD